MGLLCRIFGCVLLDWHNCDTANKKCVDCHKSLYRTKGRIRKWRVKKNE